ncbi:CheR family methyltransferase [Shewanella psychrotolerans]|uniref:CheR family methyltransferase n=1 Tax=Shewanella psychrotolerans TaxID=2864206 RepID=UPI001C656C49|nr:protein-glutamate O-methyltransferase CheR [Shewanella psychrotolerans]QYK01515.1 protein-glutamate O-methyltransferase CheR [Shewanella psychrotolerans]
MTMQDFEFIRNLAYQESGIVLPERKQHMVYSRLSRRVRQLKFSNFSQYCAFIQQHPEEMINFINALTTNLTAFFREQHHFDYLEQHLVPLWKRKSHRRLRVWSSACSSGEEPYSIAMTLAQHFPPPNWDLKILATDLDTNVLNKANTGRYNIDSIANLPIRLQKECFEINPRENSASIVEQCKKLVHFKQLNLLGDWPMKGSFDLIFCRNVLIYFDNPTKAKIIEKFRQLLSDDGHLFIGHSETLHNISQDFTLIGQTIYQPIYLNAQRRTSII